MSKQVKCVIIDDEEYATKVIESHISQIKNLELVGIYHSAVEAFLELEKKEVDVLFLDIQMPKVSGIKMMEILKNPPLTVFTTAHREYALEGFELDVLDYLLKPISFARFLKAVNKINKALLQNQPQKLANSEKETTRKSIFIRSNRQMIKIYMDKILYIEAIKNHIKINTLEGNHISLIGISEFHNQLDHKNFIRIHRSYIVNKKHISCYSSELVRIHQIDLPIGKSFRSNMEGI